VTDIAELMRITAETTAEDLPTQTIEKWFDWAAAEIKTLREKVLSESITLNPCSLCGSDAETKFFDVHDLHTTVIAYIECSVCDNESEQFHLPDDQSCGHKAMGYHIEKLASLHWNTQNPIKET